MKISEKIQDMLISALIKKGIAYEARLVDVEFDIPNGDGKEKTIIKCKIDHMTLTVKKDE